MLRAGAVRQDISLALNAAYGDGLLSESTLAHRLDELLHSRLIEPDQLIGDLSVRVPRGASWQGLRRVLGGWRRLVHAVARAESAPLLALDWTGQTEELLVGRHPACDVVLDAPTVSRRHARLRFRDGNWILQDLDSTNGTSVNRARVARCQLRPGDRLTVGGQPLVVD